MSDLVQEMAAAMVAARDLCGNEGDAARQIAEDRGERPTDEDMIAAIREANAIWRQSQQQAGVPQEYWT